MLETATSPTHAEIEARRLQTPVRIPVEPIPHPGGAVAVTVGASITHHDNGVVAKPNPQHVGGVLVKAAS